MKIKILLFAISLIIGEISVSQTVLMHEKISDYDFDVPKRGPNFRHFTHLFLGFSFYIPERKQNEIDCVYGATTAFSVGYRYKFKVTNFFALGASLSYTNDIFSIKQNKEKTFPNAVQHRQEKMRFNSLGSDVFMRFNIGKRGNVIGRFIDIGAYYNWVFVARHVYKDHTRTKQTSTRSSGKQKVVLSDLDYITRFHYGIKGRIGINRFVLTATYRLNELLNDKCSPIFLPRLNAGLEIGLHK